MSSTNWCFEESLQLYESLYPSIIQYDALPAVYTIWFSPHEMTKSPGAEGVQQLGFYYNKKHAEK